MTANGIPIILYGQAVWLHSGRDREKDGPVANEAGDGPVRPKTGECNRNMEMYKSHMWLWLDCGAQVQELDT